MHSYTYQRIILLNGITSILLACAIVPVITFSVTTPIGSSAGYLSNIGTNNNISNDNGTYSGHDASESSKSIMMDTPACQSLPAHLRLEKIPGKGLGVITNVRIPQATVVGDYKGEVMTEEEKDRRYLDSFSHLRQPVDEEWIKSRIDRGQTLTGTYLYGVVAPNGSHIFVDAEDEYHIDVNWTRFLNHASTPDANVNPKSLHAGIDGKPRVWFVSIRDIEVGEEICFDYGDDYWLPEDNVV